MKKPWKTPFTYRRKWAANNLEKCRAYRAQFKKSHPDYYAEWKSKNRRKLRDLSLRWKYGISIRIFELLLEAQGGVCAICRGGFGSKGPCVDHEHATGHVRGILCKQCNSTLGYVRERQEILFGAIRYLRKTENKQ